MHPLLLLCFRVGFAAAMAVTAAHAGPATNVTAFPTATERLERAAQAGRAAGVFHWVIRDVKGS